MFRKKSEKDKPGKASGGAGPTQAEKGKPAARAQTPAATGKSATSKKTPPPSPVKKPAVVATSRSAAPAKSEAAKAGKPAVPKPNAVKGTPPRKILPKPVAAPKKAPPKPAARQMPAKAPMAAPAPSSGAVKAPPMPPPAPPLYPLQSVFQRDLPGEYDDTRLVALVRDPEWVFLYWEISAEARQRFGIPRGAHSKSLALRVYDVTGVHFDGGNAHSFFDVEVNDFASSWYLRIPESDRAYIMDLGTYDKEGNFHPIARSNAVMVPPAGMSDLTGEEWMNVTEEQFAEIFRLSGGLRLREQVGSAEFGRRKPEEMLAELRRQWVGSGMWSGASGAIPKPPGKQRGFWLEVGCDVIIYGATDPGAKVTLQGKPVQLSPDGRFHARFALPDGQIDMPVRATSPDGEETREVTPIVSRETH